MEPSVFWVIEAGRASYPAGPNSRQGGHGPDAGGEGLDLAAAGDDEAEAPGVAGDAAPGVGAIEEVEGRRLRLPRGPAEHLVEDGRLEEGAVGRGLLIAEEAGERGVRPVELGALDQPGGDGRQERAQEDDLVRSLGIT